MKKLLILTIILLYSYILSAQTEKCPRGTMHECPGLCGLFIDENNDGFCDYSTVTEQLVTDTVMEEFINMNNQQEGDIETNEDTTAKDPALTEEDIKVEDNNTKPHKKKNKKSRYPLIFISLITLIPYLITSILVKTKTIKKQLHRKIWNYILLITFTVAGILGLVLVIQINYNIMMNLFLGNLKLHVEFGISMAIISIIHMIWHWKYYFSMKKQKD
jgi:cation transport ATPase